jgi:hypothetical protein
MVIILAALQAVFADEEQTKDFSIMPVLFYEYLRFEEQQVHSSGEGIVFTKGNMTPPVSEDRDSLMISGLFKQYFVMESRDGYDYLYHDINIRVERKIKQHIILGILSSQAAEPFYGGLHTFIGGLGYGYELIRNETISLTLGCGLGVGDFGLELPNGTVWPVLPVPTVRFNAKSSWVNFSFEFLQNISTAFTFFPESKIRLTGIFSIDPFGIRSIRDLYFDATLWYRLFSKESKMGDFAGIGLGFKNSGFGFTLPDKEKSYAVNYYSADGILDLSFLQLSAGYSFNGIEIFDLVNINKIGNGFFISAMLRWQF